MIFKVIFATPFYKMLKIKRFTFNPFQENTYLIYNELKECIIFDPGMYNASEQMELDAFIKSEQLLPIRLINTHCHIDHILGNKYCIEQYQLELSYHEKEEVVLDSGYFTAKTYGLNYDPSPKAHFHISESSGFEFGGEQVKLLFTPGHSPGSLSFYFEKSAFVIAGDVLFFQSIGRTDLPGGDYDTLINSISKEMFSLPNNTVVYSGHGPQTTIGHEKQFNPFLNS